MKRTLSDIAKELNAQSGFASSPGLIFITDQQAQPCPEDVINKLPENSMVILRDYDHENRYDMAKALGYVCKSKGIKFLVAGDLALALAIEADGIHLPGHMIKDVANIKSDHPEFFVSLACHDKKDIELALTQNADAALLAPIFPTQSHPETIESAELTIGVDRLTKLCRAYAVPIYALGGVNKETAMALESSGVTGIAAIRGFD